MLEAANLALTLSCCLIIASQRACDYLDPCGIQQAKSVLSPNGKKRFWLFVRDCGATTGFTSQISILDADEELPRRAGNTVIIDLPLGSSHADVRVSWKDRTTLDIAYPRGSQLLHRRGKVDGVTIRYREATTR